MNVDLRAERRTRGMLLKDAAAQAGISISLMSLVERGERIPSPPVALRIAEFYGYTIVDIWPRFGERAHEVSAT